MTDHPELLNGAYALDAVDDVERAAVERHLRDCPTCAIEVAEFAEAAARLGAAGAVAPPIELRDRVLASARTTRQVPPRVPRNPARPGRARVAVASAAAVAVLAGTVGTTWWVQQNRVDDERARVVAAQQETVRMRVVLAAPDATLRVSRDTSLGRFTAVYSASQGAAVLTFDELSDVPTGKTYQLWRVSRGTARSLAVLPPDARAGSRVVDDLDPGDTLAVSVEDEGGSPQPTQVYATVAMS